MFASFPISPKWMEVCGILTAPCTLKCVQQADFVFKSVIYTFLFHVFFQRKIQSKISHHIRSIFNPSITIGQNLHIFSNSSKPTVLTKNSNHSKRLSLFVIIQWQNHSLPLLIYIALKSQWNMYIAVARLSNNVILK